MWLGFTVNGSPGNVGTALRPGHVLVYTGQVADLNGVINPNGAVAGSQAAQIDRKLDDGVPSSGSVVGFGTGCRAGADYNEQDIGLCSMYIQVQG